MRYMDLLKAQPQVINQDGKQYQFTPGDQGSLIVKSDQKTPQLDVPMSKAKAKSLPYTPAPIGSVRG